MTKKDKAKEEAIKKAQKPSPEETYKGWLKEKIKAAEARRQHVAAVQEIDKTMVRLDGALLGAQETNDIDHDKMVAEVKAELDKNKSDAPAE